MFFFTPKDFDSDAGRKKMIRSLQLLDARVEELEHAVEKISSELKRFEKETVLTKL